MKGQNMLNMKQLSPMKSWRFSRSFSYIAGAQGLLKHGTQTAYCLIYPTLETNSRRHRQFRYLKLFFWCLIHIQYTVAMKNGANEQVTGDTSNNVVTYHTTTADGQETWVVNDFDTVLHCNVM